MSKFSSSSFSFKANINSTGMDISMVVKPELITTASLPHTFSFLKNHFPSVLTTHCFNDKKLSFAKEVTITEFGHLFEHILIEYLYLLKSANNDPYATCNGRTEWNWQMNQYGSFSIHIETSETEVLIFEIALEKTVNLIEMLLMSHQEDTSSYLLLE